MRWQKSVRALMINRDFFKVAFIACVGSLIFLILFVLSRTYIRPQLELATGHGQLLDVLELATGHGQLLDVYFTAVSDLKVTNNCL